MMPFSNVIAGILIGIANDTWFARLIIPFVWGLAFCIYISILGTGRRDAFIAKAEVHGRKLKWGMSPVQAFYCMEYITASFTSLAFSVLSGAINTTAMIF